jgi:hypothetical protein
MDISGKPIWQQAAGDTDRDYSKLCLDWDVILNGPGYAGAWPACATALSSDGWSARKITDLRRFSGEIKDGDFIVLRLGTSTVLGFGQIVGNYEWRDEFGDVDGWDLQHVRRVRWLWRSENSPKQFDTYALKQGDTTQKLNSGPVMDWASNLNVSEDAIRRPLVALPSSTTQIETSPSEISEYLFDRGVASASITKLLDEMGELTRIAKWYQRSTNKASEWYKKSTNKPSEHETVAYLVVPLLRALGWTPQRMAVEWNYVDLALFEHLPRGDESLQVVVEAKRMENSCLSAMSQAMTYANGKLACHRLIVTDGLRYGVYVRREVERFELYAYMNLTRRRADYPVYGCKGVKEALLAMAPEWKFS